MNAKSRFNLWFFTALVFSTAAIAGTEENDTEFVLAAAWALATWVISIMEQEFASREKKSSSINHHGSDDEHQKQDIP